MNAHAHGIHEHERAMNHRPGGSAGSGPQEAGAGSHDHAGMIADYRRRFWASLAVMAPILLLSPMIQGFLGLTAALAFRGDTYVNERRIKRWLETPCVVWRSILHRPPDSLSTPASPITSARKGAAKRFRMILGAM
jgi:hypothetical protein